jgi:hypothetical protein
MDNDDKSLLNDMVSDGNKCPIVDCYECVLSRMSIVLGLGKYGNTNIGTNYTPCTNENTVKRAKKILELTGKKDMIEEIMK